MAPPLRLAIPLAVAAVVIACLVVRSRETTAGPAPLADVPAQPRPIMPVEPVERRE